MPSPLAGAYSRLREQAPFVPLGNEGGGIRRVGRGRARLVVLPGLIGPADPLAALGEALADSHETAFVTYPRAANLAALIDWLEALRRELGGASVAVYGGSFGGLVAQAWLRTFPASMTDLIVSGVGPPDPARAAKNARLLPWFGRLPMSAWRRLLGLAVRLSTAGTPDRNLWRAAYGADIDTLAWPDLAARYRVSINVDRAGPPAAEALAAWPGRMLVLEGAKDRVARGPQRAALRAVYPRASFHVFDGAGHGLALAQPDAWLRVVTTFLNGAPGR
ncbi:MAG: alpha/beta hydrolase [Acidobacteria bacterium]|nr:alpha/beta hydrolase [Acidobacteriota bacterium]